MQKMFPSQVITRINNIPYISLLLNDNKNILWLTEIEENCLMKLQFFFEFVNSETKEKYLSLPDIYCWKKYFLCVCL